MAETKYALTAKGYDRAEAGFPDKPSDYFSVLGALVDLEEKYNGAKATTEYEIKEALGEPRKPIYLTLKSLTRNGLIEVISPGDERFKGG